MYTTLLILIQVSAKYATNLFPPSQLESILANPADIANRIYGSKIVIGLEQCMLLSTWGVKTCLVTMYWKLTQRLRWHLFVQILAGYVVLGFVVIEITYFGVYCRPFEGYWAVPPQNEQCATYQHYSITQAVFNISSDACMLAIPVPLLKGAQMHIRKKILLMSVLGLGVFVIVAAILNKYFNFASPMTTIYQLWYIREASTAIYVANLMCWWPLLRKIFGSALAQYSSAYRHRYGYDPSVRRSTAPGTLSGTVTSTTGKRQSRHKRWWSVKGGGLASASQEAITNDTQASSGSGRASPAEVQVPLEIWRKVEYNVEQHVDPRPE